MPRTKGALGKNPFPEILKAERAKRKLSQAQMAQLLSVSKRTLEHWESGQRTPLQVTIEGATARLSASAAPDPR